MALFPIRVVMAVRTPPSTENEQRIALQRNRLVLEQARAAGLLGEAKNTRLSGRVPASLIEAAKGGPTYPRTPNFWSSHCRVWRLKTILARVLSGAREASRQISILPMLTDE
jgi:hypothetical protein